MEVHTSKSCFLQAYTTPELETRSIFATCHVNISCGASPAAGQRRWRSTGRGSPWTRCPARTRRPCRCRWWWSRRGAGRPASGAPRPWAGTGAPARTTGGTLAPPQRSLGTRPTTTGRPASRRCSPASRCRPAHGKRSTVRLED